MTAISWKNPANGNWNAAANWSTDTVPTLADAVTISAFGPYIVTVSSPDLADTLTFNASEAALFENAGSLTMAGALTVDAGFVSLNEANTIASVALAGGTLTFGNGGALGAGTVTLSGGELLATANETLTNALSFSGSSTIAAAHGTTLNENASSLSIGASSTLNFGALGEDGTILWHTPGSTSFGSPLPAINVQAGTLKGADSSFGFFLADEAITVAAGATLDLAGNGTEFTDLSGGGSVIDSGAAATLTLDATNFSGAISGPLSLVVNGTVVLSGANTYTGTTGINSGDSLQIGAGATGSIGAGAISDAGTLTIDGSNAITLAGPIAGAGVLKQVGTGVTSINAANTYTGGTTLSAGTLAIGNASALGTGTLTFTSGELLGTTSETFANAIDLSTSGSTTTLAAAPGTTLTLTGGFTFAGNNTVQIGAPGQDGDVVWKGGPTGTATGDKFDVLDGTLTAGNLNLEITLNAIAGTTVEAGATLDWAGNGAEIDNLQGAGTVTNSGAAETMSLSGTTNFSGTISGALSLGFEGNASLSGLEDYTGGATLEGLNTVANTGTYDIVSNNGISGSSGSLFINNGLFEKTGGGGVSDVTSNFINSGTLNVLSGSIEFTGGFTNDGVIHGLVTQSGGVTTVSAPVPSDFNGDALSDILWRNTNGDAQIWNSNGSGGFSDQDLGVVDNGYQIAGTADFNGDGKADILWRNTNGDVYLWNSNGSGGFSGQDLGVVGSDWQIAGTGDFNGSGEASILWRNANGDTELWNPNGSGGFTGQDLGVVGSDWQIAGTGDFTGGGEDGILWRNANGDVQLWNSNGAGGFTDQDLGVVGSDWQIAGTGDFTGNGDDGILWRNANGDTALWNPNGSGGFTFQDLGVVGSDWQIAATGDFSGSGKDGILWRNSNGDVALWNPNGSGGFSSQDLGVVSNSFKIQSSFG
jgi:autotransporter-associated beta strand protein